MYINEENEDLDNDLFNTLNKAIHNQKEIKSSTNYKIMTDYLSRLKKTRNGKNTDLKTRLEIVRELLKNDNHFIELTEKLFACFPSDRDFLLPKLVEFPLECMSSYVQGTTNSNSYLRRKYFDGQIRKRKDGTTYKRAYNVSTEADLIYIDEDGKEISPLDLTGFVDKYFDDIQELLSIFDGEEKRIVLLINYLGDKATIKQIEKYTGYTKRQVETMKKKIKYKTLKWLHDNEIPYIYNHYYNLCKKYKKFEEDYKNFCEKCEKV